MRSITLTKEEVAGIALTKLCRRDGLKPDFFEGGSFRLVVERDGSVTVSFKTGEEDGSGSKKH